MVHSLCTFDAELSFFSQQVNSQQKRCQGNDLDLAKSRHLVNFILIAINQAASNLYNLDT